MVNLSNIAKNLQWIDNLRSNAIEHIKNECKELPHGSGLDTGVIIDLDRSRPDKIVFNTEFHHLNKNGYYDGWTVHTIIVTPKFGGFNLKVTGVNRNGIKEYLTDLFHSTFN